MKKSGIFLFVVVFTSVLNLSSLQAQNDRTGLSLGMQLNQYHNDFGLGLQLTSPYFAEGWVAVRARGNFMYNENVQNAETVWSPYGHASIGMVSTAGRIGDFMRLYAEGGLITLFPNPDFSSETLVPGGYGLFGFEFFFEGYGGYFIELGGVGTGASADRIMNEPIYSNGFVISTGFRVHFKRKDK